MRRRSTVSCAAFLAHRAHATLAQCAMATSNHHIYPKARPKYALCESHGEWLCALQPSHAQNHSHLASARCAHARTTAAEGARQPVLVGTYVAAECIAGLAGRAGAGAGLQAGGPNAAGAHCVGTQGLGSCSSHAPHNAVRSIHRPHPPLFRRTWQVPAPSHAPGLAPTEHWPFCWDWSAAQLPVTLQNWQSGHAVAPTALQPVRSQAPVVHIPALPPAPVQATPSLTASHTPARLHAWNAAQAEAPTALQPVRAQAPAVHTPALHPVSVQERPSLTATHDPEALHVLQTEQLGAPAALQPVACKQG